MLRIIIVEDNPSDAELIIRRLMREGFQLEWQRVENEDEYSDALNGDFDLILSDWSLPQFSGLRALQITRERNIDAPFIIISGSIGEEAAVDALHLGASDYLLKDRPERLGKAIHNAIKERQLRKEYQQAERMLRIQASALNAAANAIVITDVEGVIEWVNEAFTTLTGYTREESIGRNPREFLKSGVHPETFYQDMWETILAGKVWHGELTNRRKDGQMYLEEQTITPVRNAAGQISQFIAIKQDITERKKAEQDLRETHEFLDNLVNYANAPIIVWDPNLRITRFNHAFEHLTGHRFEEVFGKHLDILFPKESRRESIGLIEQTLNGDHWEGVEIPIINRSGETRVVLWNSANLFGPDNRKIIATIAQGQDITDRKRAEKQLVEASEDLRFAYDATLQGWSSALELRERETAGHSQRVVQTTLTIARRMGINEAELVHFQRGALLHDIGKMGIPDSILLKPGPLTAEEWEIMRQHPTLAYNLLSKIPFLVPALDIPHYHHERWDGSGYPKGLRGTEIPISARIFALVDIWDALSYDRPYRSAWAETKVIDYLMEQAGKQLDPQVVDVFLQVMAERKQSEIIE